MSPCSFCFKFHHCQSIPANISNGKPMLSTYLEFSCNYFENLFFNLIRNLLHLCYNCCNSASLLAPIGALFVIMWCNMSTFSLCFPPQCHRFELASSSFRACWHDRFLCMTFHWEIIWAEIVMLGPPSLACQKGIGSAQCEAKKQITFHTLNSFCSSPCYIWFYILLHVSECKRFGLQ